MLLESLGRELVAGCPVIDVGEKVVHTLNALAIVFQLRQDEGVKLVLVEVGVGQCVQECPDVFLLGQFFCQCAEVGSAYPDYGVGGYCRDKLALKVPVLFVLQCVEAVQYHYFLSVSSLSLISNSTMMGGMMKSSIANATRKPPTPPISRPKKPHFS